MDTLKHIGIEIGGTKLQLVAGNGRGEILDRRRLSVFPGSGGAGIRDQIAHALPELVALHRPTSIGVGFGGPVDRASGRIACSHQVPGWSDFPIGPWLEELAGLKTVVENDANTATLAEAVCGAGTGADPVFYVTLGSGVGGGLVAGGKIYHGAKPGEAEIGHVRLDRAGTIVESRCSGWAVDQKIRTACGVHPASILAEMTRGLRGGEAARLAAAIERGDTLARSILEETAGDLAFGLSHVVQLFHPEVIVLGGGLSLTGALLREAVARHLKSWVMEVFLPGPEVRLAGLGEDAVPVGALLLANRSVGG